MARACRLHQACRTGHLHVAAAGAARPRQGRGGRARGDGRDRRPGGALPGAAAARALRGHRPLDRVRAQPVPAAGPPRQRHAAGAHARGDVHAARRRHLLLVQGAAADAVPDPDEVPRRGATPRRAAARPRVHHEGRLLLRPRRHRAREVLHGPARRLPADLRPARAGVRHRHRHLGRDGRLPQRGVPVPVRHRRGHVRALARRLRGQRGGRRDAAPAAARPGGRRGAAARRRARHPEHAHDRDARRRRQRRAPARRRPGLDGRGHAEERRGHLRAPGRGA